MRDRVSARSFAEKATRLLSDMTDEVIQPIEEAAELITPRLRAGGVIQAFGTGHSQAGALEIAGRAGGLIPTNRIALSDLVLHGDESPDVLADPLLERTPGLATRLLELVSLRPEDVFVIVSSSGINRSIVDMATEVKERGYPLVAITSEAHSNAIASRHPSGKTLSDMADIVIDNHAPSGDAMLPLTGGGAVCAVSSLTTSFVVQMLVAEIVRRVEAAGAEAPVYVSANIPGGHERNVEIEARYDGRLRRWAF